MAEKTINQTPNIPPLPEFLSLLAGLSFDVTPELQEISDVIDQAEEREGKFADRLRILKDQISNQIQGKTTPVSGIVRDMSELISLYQEITAEKERLQALRRQTAARIGTDFIKHHSQNSKFNSACHQEEGDSGQAEEEAEGHQNIISAPTKGGRQEFT